MATPNVRSTRAASTSTRPTKPFASASDCAVTVARVRCCPGASVRMIVEARIGSTMLYVYQEFWSTDRFTGTVHDYKSSRQKRHRCTVHGRAVCKGAKQRLDELDPANHAARTRHDLWMALSRIRLFTVCQPVLACTRQLERQAGMTTS